MQKTFKGMVIRGDGIAGRDFDTPTANLDIDATSLDTGVYAAFCAYNGKTYESTVCFGAGDPPKFEVFLHDFAGDLFGKTMEVTIISKISELVPWDSSERMRQKILHDIQLSRQVFEKHEKN